MLCLEMLVVDGGCIISCSIHAPQQSRQQIIPTHHGMYLPQMLLMWNPEQFFMQHHAMITKQY